MTPLTPKHSKFGFEMEKSFDALQGPEEWRAGFTVFYLKDEADLWWATVRER